MLAAPAAGFAAMGRPAIVPTLASTAQARPVFMAAEDLSLNNIDTQFDALQKKIELLQMQTEVKELQAALEASQAKLMEVQGSVGALADASPPQVSAAVESAVAAVTAEPEAIAATAAPVAEQLAPAAAPAVEQVVPAVAPVIEQVAPAAAPVAEQAAAAVAPVAEQAAAAVAPVTDVVPDAAASAVQESAAAAAASVQAAAEQAAAAAAAPVAEAVTSVAPVAAPAADAGALETVTSVVQGAGAAAASAMGSAQGAMGSAQSTIDSATTAAGSAMESFSLATPVFGVVLALAGLAAVGSLAMTQLDEAKYTFKTRGPAAQGWPGVPGAVAGGERRSEAEWATMMEKPRTAAEWSAMESGKEGVRTAAEWAAMEAKMRTAVQTTVTSPNGSRRSVAEWETILKGQARFEKRSATSIVADSLSNLAEDPIGWFYGPPSALNGGKQSSIGSVADGVKGYAASYLGWEAAFAVATAVVCIAGFPEEFFGAFGVSKDLALNKAGLDSYNSLNVARDMLPLRAGLALLTMGSAHENLVVGLEEYIRQLTYGDEPAPTPKSRLAAEDATVAIGSSYIGWEAAFWSAIALVAIAGQPSEVLGLPANTGLSQSVLPAFTLLNLARLDTKARIGLALLTAPWAAKTFGKPVQSYLRALVYADQVDEQVAYYQPPVDLQPTAPLPPAFQPAVPSQPLQPAVQPAVQPPPGGGVPDQAYAAAAAAGGEASLSFYEEYMARRAQREEGSALAAAVAAAAPTEGEQMAQAAAAAAAAADTPEMVGTVAPSAPASSLSMYEAYQKEKMGEAPTAP